MITADLRPEHLAAIADVAADTVHLPGVATQDWCDAAACTLLPLRPDALVVVTIAAEQPHERAGGIRAATTIEATGGVMQQQGVVKSLPRMHGDGTGALGWSLAEGWMAQADHSSAEPGRVARLRDLPAVAANWTASTSGKRWSRLGVNELLIAQTPLESDRHGRFLALELGLRPDQATFGRGDVEVIRAIMPTIRRRASLAFGNTMGSVKNRITPREQQILEQLTLGKTVREIATDLSRSQHTVHDHVKSLHRKLDASSRGELIARYLGHRRSGAATAATLATAQRATAHATVEPRRQELAGAMRVPA